MRDNIRRHEKRRKALNFVYLRSPETPEHNSSAVTPGERIAYEAALAFGSCLGFAQNRIPYRKPPGTNILRFDLEEILAWTKASTNK